MVAILQWIYMPLEKYHEYVAFGLQRDCIQ